jgi:small-conductance mechanosensitive channel
MRLEARQQDRRISDLDQQLKGLEQQKAAVVQQGLPQDQARASVQGIDRQIDQVKQQLGAELKAMEPRLQAANQAMEKASQELKLPQPPKLSVEGIKPEQARAASEYVNASSMAQQALSSALSGGGSKEVQKAVAAAKIAIEAATAISNPVSLAKAAITCQPAPFPCNGSTSIQRK